MKFFIKIIFMILVFNVTLFGKDIATITALNGKAFIQRDGAETEVTIGAHLQEKDTIVTKDRAKVQIVFKDETIVTVGKNSNFSIKEYLFEENQESVSRFGMLKGAMRIITGKIGKIAPEKFSVKTKNSTIGIRGTNFTIVVGSDNSQNIYCTHGAISVTINGVEHILKQGFYIIVSSSEKVKLQEFSSKELKKMRKNNFVNNQRKNIKTNKYIQLSNSKQLGAIKYNKRAKIIKYITSGIENATLTARLADATVVDGWTIDNSIENFSSRVKLSILSSPTELFSEESWLKDSIIDSNADVNEWQFFISSSPISYSSKERFSTTFSSVTVIPSGDGFSNPRIIESSFIATGDDLADDDYMSWGSWSASLLYDHETMGEDQTHDIFGLWVMGVATDIDVVEALNSMEFYSGIYRAYNFTNDTNLEGIANMNVDFGADSANLYVEDATFNLSIVGNGMSGTLVDGTGRADGTFYGPKAQSIGGHFNISDNDVARIKGIYEVQRITVDQAIRQ